MHNETLSTLLKIGLAAVAAALFFAIAAGQVPAGAATPAPATGARTGGLPPAPPTIPPTVTPLPTPCTVEFADVPPSDPFYAYIRCLACRGILNGYADGTFRTNTNVTRGQAAKIVANAAGYSETPGAPTFADVPESQPFYLWIERTAEHGVVAGYDCGGPGEPCDAQNRKYFRPSADVTRGQLAKIVAQAARYADVIPSEQQTFADVPPMQPFWLWTERVAAHAVISGYDCGGPGEPCDAQNRKYFRPAGNATRGQTAKILTTTFFPACVTP